MNLAIETKKVNRVFQVGKQKTWVVKDIDLQIEKGKFVIIFGPSGCGKSTLLNMITGLDDITAGEVSLLGNEISHLSPDEKAEIRKQNLGMIYQQSYWVKSLSVIENVALPLLIKGFDKRAAIEEAEKQLVSVGMENWGKYSPVELSSGQQQKVAMARALVTNPEMIIADEPTGNLDTKSSAEIMQIFAKLKKLGKTIVMVTHDHNNLMQADEIVHIIDGRIANVLDVSKFKAKLDLEKALDIDTKEFNSKNFDEKMNGLAKIFDKKKRLSPQGLLRLTKQIGLYFYKVLVFIPVAVTYYLYKFFAWFFRVKFLSKGYKQFVELIAGTNKGGIAYLELLFISFKNLFSKKVRVYITIGGVAIGIAFIVFLSSIGYGVERLIVNRVAGLNELNQTEAIPSAGTNVFIDDQRLSEFEQIPEVESVMPVVSIAGQASISGSNTDLVVYGILSDYLTESNARVIEGEVFDDEDTKYRQERSLANYVVVNKAFIDVLGIVPSDAIGLELEVELFTPNNLIATGDEFTDSLKKFEVVGVVSELDNPIVYAPISELKATGISRYSQARLSVANGEDLSVVRRQLEVAGFNTVAVVDTVNQIESLFTVIRQLFVVIGGIALFVGSLGMFNTLTVSLLERTREVGLLKAVGMKSREIYDLFLFEAMTMGIWGGVVGLLLGFLAGKGLSLILTLISVSRGYESLDIAYIPLWLTVAIVIISTAVGALTGIIPSLRATKISPIDALRYE